MPYLSSAVLRHCHCKTHLALLGLSYMPEKLSYPKESAGSHLLSRVPTVAPETTAGETKRLVLDPGAKWDEMTYVYVTDAQKKLLGVFSLRELFAARDVEKAETLMQKNLVVAHPYTDQEHVAMRAIAHHIQALPVVDKSGVFLGIVGVDAILRTLHEEHTEDFLRSAGILKTRVVTDIFNARFGQLFRQRVPWLFFGLLGAMGATLLVRSFEHVLMRELSLAFFMPLIVYMAAAIGVQTQTLYVRSLVLGSSSVKKLFPRELGMGLAIGLCCAGPLFLFALVAFQSFTLAWIVGTALILTMFSGVAVALVITTVLMQTKKDPALGGGPFATIVQDILSIIIYFAVATAVLFGFS